MPLHIWGVMGAESGFWLGARDTPGPARKHILGWALGHSGYHPNTSQKLSFLAGHSGYHPNTDQNKWFWLPVGVWDTTQQPARTHISWAVLGISSKTSQKTHSGWAFGHSGWDITRIPARNAFSGWHSGYHPNHTPYTNPEKTVLAGHSGYNPTTSQSRHFLAGARDIIQKPARKHRSGWAFRISPEYQPENTFGLGV
ncbi:hypothetical protein BYT27DRAFT_7337313 [Phlegmacium glaucopus]|nr:hypothetical protein BYT27DRAFT_7337313 [Phlegmacium glaucopus]